LLDVLIQTFNEELNLPHTLRSLNGWANRVFVVDSGSTDRTCEIAREHGATVVHHDWEGYARQKNWALDNLPFEAPWVLIADADEAVSPELQRELIAVTDRPVDATPEAGFMINRVFIFNGRKIWHCGYFPSWNMRLVKHGKARYEDRSVHEHMIVDGKEGRLEHLLLHEDRRGLENFFAKHNRYSTLEARELFMNPEDWPGFAGLWNDQTKRRRFLKSRLLPYMPFPHIWRFVYMYVLQRGFLDGRSGLELSRLISLYELLIRVKYREVKRLVREQGIEALQEPPRPARSLVDPEGSPPADPGIESRQTVPPERPTLPLT
jgi:glycosyltransferase involved in cell wall biosynthesis